MKKQDGYTLYEGLWLGFFALFMVGVGGWIANIVKLIGMDFGSVTGLLIARAVGIVVAPLGAVLGFV